MKLTDYIVSFLASKGVNAAFGMSGGAAVHLFDSIEKSGVIKVLSMTHEQCAAIAADGYYRSTGKLGVAITTSGPGATNLLTGVCCSYYDSIPVLLLTGQVATHRLKGNIKVRQVGFQETDVISIYGSVTKYAIQITDPLSIKYHLEKAYFTAFDGRQGPVLLDIPDDIQRAEIEPDKLHGFIPDNLTGEDISNDEKDVQIRNIISLVQQSYRPVVILGSGLKTPRIHGFEEILELLNIPILLTWGGNDLIPYNHRLRVGTFGVYGSRLGNFTIQNSDLIIAMGTRLSQNLTGGILNSFARAAKIVMIDIDINEITKFEGRGIKICIGLKIELSNFFHCLKEIISDLSLPSHDKWKKTILSWGQELPNDLLGKYYNNNKGFIDAYQFMEVLSLYMREDEEVFVDTGGNLTWTCNGVRLRKHQKLHSAWNNTPMGYSLPASIGAAMSGLSQHITCIIGDGGLMICLAELATVARNNLPIKIFLINNHGHGIQKQTLQTWLNGSYVGVDEESGLAFPKNYQLLIEGFGIKYIKINSEDTLQKVISEVYLNSESIFVDVEINPDQKLYPFLKYGYSLENQMPLIDEALIDKLMLIPKYDEVVKNKIASLQSKEGW